MSKDLEREALTARVRQVMSDVFLVDASRIPVDAEMGISDHWDSANHVNLVLALEEELGLSFDVSEIEAMTSIPAIVSIADAKLKKKR